MATKTPSRNDKTGRRRKVTKFALAGVAVLGVGAALTSAAWSDSVFFSGSAEAGSVDLKGRISGDPAFVNGPIAIPASTFDGLAPLQPKTVTLEVLNDGDGILTLNAPAVSNKVGQFLTGAVADDIAITFGSYSDGSLAPGESAWVVMTLTPPNWDNTAQGVSGNTFTVEIQGTT